MSNAGRLFDYLEKLRQTECSVSWRFSYTENYRREVDLCDFFFASIIAKCFALCPWFSP